MKITFFQNFAYENLSLEYLSAALKEQGHKTELIINPNIPFFKKSINEITHEIKDTNPDFIAFSANTVEYQEILSTAKELKKSLKNTPFIIGGIHASCTYNLIKKEKCFDYICVGDGEKSFTSLITAIENKEPTDKIPNIFSTKTNTLFKPKPYGTDINSLPLPDKDIIYNLYPKFITDTYNIMTTRGCPYNCSFCYTSTKGNAEKLSRRTPENVIKELKIAKEKYTPKNIYFLDSVFTYDKKWLEAFLPLYMKEIHKPFFCDIHPLCTDEDIISALKEAGCRCVNLGIQTLNEKTRNEVFNRTESNAQIIETMRIVKKYKISLFAHIIYDIQNETKNDLVQNAIFLNQNKPDIIIPFSLTYYPKTKITKDAANTESLSIDQLKDIYRGKNFNSFNQSQGNEKGKLIALILTANIFPKSIFNYLIRTKAYRFFPAKLIFTLYLILMPVFNRIILKKHNFPYFYLHKRIHFILFFTFKNLKNKYLTKPSKKIRIIFKGIEILRNYKQKS